MGITFLLGACGMQFNKTSELDSLLDFGTVKEPKKDSSSTTHIKDPIKSVTSTHYGIDISHFQGDLMKMYTSKGGMSYVICKATQGNYFVDPDFRSNWNEIREHGLIRGAYHFYDCKIDPEVQALFFATHASDINSTDIAPILDIEQGSMTKAVSGAQMETDILVFLKTVEKKFDRKPILYTDYAFAQEYLKNPEFANYDLWLAEYSGNTQPRVPDLWKEKGYKIWQKSSSYHLESERVDLDIYEGILSQLIK